MKLDVRRPIGVAALVLLSACGSEQAQDVGIDGEAVRQHMRTLSSDEFLGRGSGHIGGDMASDYIAARFEEIGLEPVGGSYFQTVPMIGSTTDRTTVQLSFAGLGGMVTPTYLDDFVLAAGDPAATEVEGAAEVVFVGYGIDSPENSWDDFGDVDVRGKVILILVNDPPAPEEEPDLFGGTAMTYYGRWTYKYEEAARQGALAALIVHETDPAGYPWTVVRGGWAGEKFALPPDPAGPAPAGLMGWVTEELATEMLALGGHDYHELKAAAGRRGFTAIPTGVNAGASLDSEVRRVETRNVVGLLRGSTAPDEFVTVTSHYDHFGVGEAIDGDSIYNGAYDNASGTALLIEMARAFTSADELDRSILFISTAAEEQGLLGAQWYVQSPLFPLNQTVAEVNIDAINLWGLTNDVIAQGEERSGLGVYVRARAAEMGLEIMPDAEPEKGYFFRSDHFPFAKAGVPSLYFGHGRDFQGKPPGWGQELLAEYTAQRYHAPTDEFSEDFVFDGAVQQGTLVYAVIADIASDTTWPTWHDGQEFKAARDAMMTGR